MRMINNTNRSLGYCYRWKRRVSCENISKTKADRFHKEILRFEQKKSKKCIENRNYVSKW